MNAQKTPVYRIDTAQSAELDRQKTPILILTRESRVAFANSAARVILGCGSDLPPLSGLELLNVLDLNQQDQLRRACQSEKAQRLDLTLHCDQQKKHIELSLSPWASDQNPEKRIHATVRDLTADTARQQLPIYFQQAMQQTKDMVMVTDHHGRIEYVNPAFVSQTGYSESDAIGNTPRLLSSGEHDSNFYTLMWKALRNGESYRSIFINQRRNGERYHEEKTITPIQDTNGQITHFVATGRDITALVNSEQRLHHLRRYDTLTGLPNRQHLSEQFEQHVLQQRKVPMALFLIDLDRLSRINDSLGRASGDELLRHTALRLREKLPTYSVGRLGSDAFIVLAKEIQTPDQAAAIAQKIQHIIAPAFQLSQADIFMEASLGITLYPYDGDQFDELVNKADSAMHRCKEKEQQFGFFTEDLTLQTQLRVKMENQLRKALLHKEFHLVFQPRVDMASGKITSAEVLLRWIRPDGKMVSPAEFIPVLEDMGLITSVGEWVLMRACSFASQWHTKGLSLGISVNLSAKQLRQPNLPQIIERCLSASGLPPSLLELELTETSMLENLDHSINQLSNLREKGIRIAIDDFGTGYSSLAYLKKLPADTLKIDRAFIQELDGQDPADRNIVKTIIQLAHDFKLSVTAEGIETKAQLNTLQELGCNEAQGFLLAKPMNETSLLTTINVFNKHPFGVNQEER